MFQVTADGDFNIRLLLHDLKRLSIHDICMVTITEPKMHDFTFVSIEGDLSIFRSLSELIEIILNVYNKENRSQH